MVNRQCLFLLVVSFMLCGCDPERYVRGRVVSAEDNTAVQKGVGTLDKTQVETMLGPASTVLNFDPNTWYYFNLFTESSGPFAPSVKENKGFALLFTPDGKLTKYVPNCGTKAFDVALKETALPSTHRREFLKELFRNAGRFGKKNAPKRK